MLQNGGSAYEELSGYPLRIEKPEEDQRDPE